MTTTLSQTEIPKDWIPIEEAGLREPNKEDQDTFSIRMNNEEYMYELWRTLAGLVPVKVKHNDGSRSTYLKKATHIEPVMSKEGASKIIALIKSQTTSAIVLSNTQEFQQKVHLNNIMSALRRELTINKKEYGLTNTQRMIVYSEIESYLNHQLLRAVKGHEAQNIITRVEEQRGEQSVTQTVNNKKSGWLGGRKQ